MRPLVNRPASGRRHDHVDCTRRTADELDSAQREGEETMTWLITIAMALIVAALATAVPLIADLWSRRRRIRRLRQARAERDRCVKLPPLPPNAFIRLDAADVIRPLPRVLRYRGHALRTIVARKERRK
jgi:hypothetical protein